MANEFRLTNLRLDMQGIKQVLNDGLAHAFMTDVGRNVVNQVQQIVPRSLRTKKNATDGAHEHLNDNLHIVVKTVKGMAGLTVSAEVDHARALHDGAKRHPIDAHNENVPLKFFWEKAGAMFIGPKVNHPGNQPLPYFKIACERLGLPYRSSGGGVTIGQ